MKSVGACEYACAVSLVGRDACQQPPEHTRDEQVAVAHLGRPEQLRLQPRQPRRRVRRVQRVVGLLQQIGDNKRRVGKCHRDDPERQPSCRRHSSNHGAERHAAERRQHRRRALAGQPAAVGPRQHKGGRHEQDEHRAGAVHQPPQGKRGQQRHGNERDICERGRASHFGGTADRNESDYRDRRDQSPPATMQCPQTRRRPPSRQRHDGALTQRQDTD